MHILLIFIIVFHAITKILLQFPDRDRVRCSLMTRPGTSGIRVSSYFFLIFLLIISQFLCFATALLRFWCRCCWISGNKCQLHHTHQDNNSVLHNYEVFAIDNAMQEPQERDCCSTNHNWYGPSCRRLFTNHPRLKNKNE